MKKQSEKKPRDYEILTVVGKPQLVVNFLVEEVEQEQQDITLWEYHSVALPAGDFEYGTIVSAVIDEIYSNDRMQAIVNNKLIGTHEEEFVEMQAFRAYAKNFARSVWDQLNPETTEEESEVNNG